MLDVTEVTEYGIRMAQARNHSLRDRAHDIHRAATHDQDTCPFCDIIADHSKAETEIVYEWDDAIVLVPHNQRTKGHLLVIPKTHVTDFADSPEVTGATYQRVAELAKLIREAGYNDDFNVITNAGPWAEQTVYHLHIHLVPRRPMDGLKAPWGQIAYLEKLEWARQAEERKAVRAAKSPSLFDQGEGYVWEGDQLVPTMSDEEAEWARLNERELAKPAKPKKVERWFPGQTTSIRRNSMLGKKVGA